jgi:hypothetical protein
LGRKGEKTRGLNLKKGSINAIHSNDDAMYRIDETMIETVHLLCRDRPGWILLDTMTTPAVSNGMCSKEVAVRKNCQKKTYSVNNKYV